MEIRLEIKNAEEISQLLKQSPEIAKEELKKSMEEAQMLLLREIKEATPVVTNVLRSSISAQEPEILSSQSLGEKSISGDSSNALSDEVIGVIGTSVNYAIPVEFGVRPFKIGSGMNPGFEGRKMFSNTMDAQDEQVQTIFARGVERILNRIANGV